ncbi:hypothetical protein BDW59DRAFT_180004 [Aspergillus cavernicola]|uniref:Zn(2)-C6 fungal-type domain-containing protein n=1 Tax=Aspergillus cavernicola TaxID=176166 RepID=A0ABR4IBF9_9EURO
MPRPKVRPENRQRSARACVACKSSKIRCDALQPCASCIRRDQADSCSYSGVDRRRRHSTVNIPENGHTRTTPRSENSRTPVSDDIVPNLLREKVYVGETSSQSFLHFLRQTVKAYIGSVPFTDGERQYVTLDVDLPIVGSDVSLNAPPEKLHSLLESYFEATSGILDLFTTEEIGILVQERTISRESTVHSLVKEDEAAALDLALAIGAQARGLSDDLPLCKAYFSHARKVALQSMFTSQSLSTIRLFLLLVFYMLGACNRNGAAMFLGVAVKAAFMLGLHGSLHDNDLYMDEKRTRLRLWNSIQNIDVLSSFILGRPKDSPLMDHGLTETKSPDNDMQSAFGAMVKVCRLIVDIIDSQRKNTGLLHVPSAETQLQRLRHWSRALPHNLRQFSTTTLHRKPLDSYDRQSLTGAMHISCVYYFAVILVTRPFLVAYLTSRLRGKAPHNLISDPDQASDINIKNNKVSRIGWVCVGASLHMVDMCVQAKTVNFTFGNLCLLKAWIFGAALVLGFSMFAGEPRQDIDDGFNNACTIIAEIAFTSPQAQLYHGILTSFASAIEAYRQRKEDEQQMTVQRYMDRVLVIHPALHSHDNGLGDRGGVHHHHDHDHEWLEEGIPATGTGTGTVDHADHGGDNTDTDSDAQLGTLLQIGNGFEEQDVVGVWHGVDMQLLDYPVIGIEPFDQFFYTVE